MSETELEQHILDQARDLLSQLEAGDSGKAMETIDTLYRQRDFGLYKEIGQLTRTVHEAIVNFDLDDSDVGEQGDCPKGSRMVDASDRLNYVIELTENAANKTMDKVEETIPLSKELGSTAEKLKGDWQRLMSRRMTADEFRTLYGEMEGFLNFTVEKTGLIDSNLSDILLAQDYQDLTGQVIKKVISLVREIQGSLVSLVRMASSVEEITGMKTELVKPNKAEVEKGPDIKAEGPILNAAEREDVVNDQDDVDDLLSSLGF